MDFKREGDLNALVTFEAQPPGGTALLLQDTDFIGEDSNAGGGSEAGLDASKTYDLNNLVSQLKEQPQQGFHILTVNADGSQGATTKHKTFWVRGCSPNRPTWRHLSSAAPINPARTVRAGSFLVANEMGACHPDGILGHPWPSP